MAEVYSGSDPSWPELPDGEHALTELHADRAGAYSPYGDTTFPRDPAELPYVHPVTVINT